MDYAWSPMPERSFARRFQSMARPKRPIPIKSSSKEQNSTTTIASA
jgi:hypothetical protein